MKDKLAALDAKLFANIGKKIKTLAKVLFGIGTIASVIGGIIYFIILIDDFSYIIHYDRWDILLIDILGSVGIPCVGTLVSWLAVLVLYAFGELVEKTTVIAKVAAKADAEKNIAE